MAETGCRSDDSQLSPTPSSSVATRSEDVTRILMDINCKEEKEIYFQVEITKGRSSDWKNGPLMLCETWEEIIFPGRS